MWAPDPGWQSYTPTFTSFTLGNGSVVARHTRQGALITVTCRVTLGTTSVMGTSPTVSLPVACVGDIVGSLCLLDNGWTAWRALS